MKSATAELAEQNGIVMIGDPSNDGERLISIEQPYSVIVKVRGICPLIFHRWSVDAIDIKAAASKGSKAKKTDDLESYVYRDEDGFISIPGEYFRMSIVNAAKFKQDPRSPRKSAMDLFKASVFPLSDHCSLGKKDWDYVDRRRAPVQRQGITRSRPAFLTGWTVEVMLSVSTPEYISPALLHEVMTMAGRLVGVADFRPTFGRYQIDSWEVFQEKISDSKLFP